MKATVIGCGRWGSFIAWYLRKIGHEVTLYGREGSKHIEQFRQTRSNGLVTLEEDVRVTTDLREALQSELICISIRSQNLPELMAQIAAQGVSGKTFALCMKGIEVTTLRRLSEIAEEAVGGSNDVAVWLGPGHVQEFLAGVPNCMVIDSSSEAVKERLISQLSGGLIRFYYGTDRQRGRGGGQECDRHCGGHAGRHGALLAQGRADEPRHAGGFPADCGDGRQRVFRLRALPSGRLRSDGFFTIQPQPALWRDVCAR